MNHLSIDFLGIQHSWALQNPCLLTILLNYITLDFSIFFIKKLFLLVSCFLTWVSLKFYKAEVYICSHKVQWACSYCPGCRREEMEYKPLFHLQASGQNWSHNLNPFAKEVGSVKADVGIQLTFRNGLWHITIWDTTQTSFLYNVVSNLLQTGLPLILNPQLPSDSCPCLP